MSERLPLLAGRSSNDEKAGLGAGAVDSIYLLDLPAGASAVPSVAGGKTVSYIVPFSLLRQKVLFRTTPGGLEVAAPYDDFIAVLKSVLRAVKVDEDWYRSAYPDVAGAIDAGDYRSATHHFVEHGYFEGRLPFEMQVDESWYLNTYPDVADGVRNGSISSAASHFKQHGYAEGRLPAAA